MARPLPEYWVLPSGYCSYAQILDRKDVSKETQRIVIKRVADMKGPGKK